VKSHSIALWAGLTALFTNFAAVGITKTINGSLTVRFVGAILASLIIGASVYCKQRWDDAKAEKEGGG
jgi:hypothetical protein